jgi:pimeloyl-ACP methyl ester carboxylesterase
MTEAAMTDFLISWRNDQGQGVPGHRVSLEPRYMEIADHAKTYDLREHKLREAWMNDLVKAGSAVLVFVHGFDNDAGKVLIRHNAIKGHLPQGVSLVSFDWAAGSPGLTPKDKYFADKENATKTAPHLLSSCLQHLVDRFTPSNVHLFAHSMGAYLTETAFQVPKVIRLNHLMMAAAAVDQSNYKTRSTILANILSKCSDVTAYWSAEDKALPEAQKWEGYTPLGLRGYPSGPIIPGNCYGVDCTSYYRTYVRPHDDEFSHVWYILFDKGNAFYIDMSEVLRDAPTTPTRTKTADPHGFVLKPPT